MQPRPADAALGLAADIPFSVNGRFSSRFGKEAVSAVFDWQHAPRQDEIVLTSPLGSRLAQIERQDATLTIRRGEFAAETFSGADWSEALQQAVGFPLPVAGLIYWIRGVPLPDADVEIERDAEQRIAQLVQQGWIISYRYTPASTPLPDFLDARFGDDITLRIKIQDWQTP